jgi:hypothetical protein
VPEHITKFLAQIEALGGTWKKDASGHYRVYKNGQFIKGFAAGHGKKTKLKTFMLNPS